MVREFQAEKLRDGEQAAKERVQAEREMEQGLLEQKLRESGSLTMEEQSHTGQRDSGDGADRVIAGSVGPSGAGGGDHVDEGDFTGTRVVPEYQGGERTFEGDGRHPLDEQ